MADFIGWVDGLPKALVYLGLGIGGALENVVPAIPADTFVAFGGFLSAVGDLQARWVFLMTWLCNVAAALVMYRIGHSHGRPFFETGVGRYVLRPHQMERMGLFYARWGTPAIFFTRFLPGIRSIVPIFAGVTRQRWPGVALPIAAASAIWYGGLVWLGALAGHNLDALLGLLARVNRALVGAAALVLAAALLWWLRTRARPGE